MFTSTKEEVEKTEEGAVTKDLLETAQQCVKAMDANIMKLKKEFAKITKKSNEKLARKQSCVSGLGTSHK